MNCPYCAEEIKDEAVFCRHCQHDFSLVKPLLARLISLERELSSFKEVVAPSSAESASFAKFAGGIAVVLGVILTSGFFFVTSQQEDTGSLLPFIFAIALPPVVLGLLVGLASSQRSPRAFAISGFAVGALNFILIWMMLGSVKGAEFQGTLSFITLVIGQSFTFTTFALLGNSLRGGWPSAKKPLVGNLESGAKRLNANLSMLVEIIKSLTSLGATIGLAYQWLRG